MFNYFGMWKKEGLFLCILLFVDISLYVCLFVYVLACMHVWSVDISACTDEGIHACMRMFIYERTTRASLSKES